MDKKKGELEIGSEFHWQEASGPFLPWPAPVRFFDLGRVALLAAWKIHTGKRQRSLFVPDYFCPDVCRLWQERGLKLRRYEDDPRWPHPRWETLNPGAGDWVLAVNYFGVRDGNPWTGWRQRNRRAVLIEDHSHDPCSAWARNSRADYAFASLRKILPVPDGAILWSPGRRLKLPETGPQGSWKGSALKLAGMIWKNEYLKAAVRDPALKSKYREFQTEGERLLTQNTGGRISPWSFSLLERGYPVSWRRKRTENVGMLLEILKGRASFVPLFRQWPKGHCPLNAVFVFEGRASRDFFRAHCVSRGIFTPVHWALGRTGSLRARELSGRMLTIPVDHRYGARDIRRVAEAIKGIK